MWVSEEYAGRVRLSLKVSAQLFQGQSALQRVEVYDTLAYGKVLVLDGVLQTSVADECVYHELLAHPALNLSERLERVLIVGGGDGGTLREVLRYRAVHEVVLAEIDRMVVDVCREYLPELSESAWDDPRLNLRIVDAIEYVGQAASDSFDLILVDGSDPVGPAEALFGPSFFAQCRRVLRPGGVFAMQSGAPFLMPSVFYPTVASLAAEFGRVCPVFGDVPLYAAGLWSWTLASSTLEPDAPRFERIQAFEHTLRVYSRAFHRAAFVPPAEIARRLASLSQFPGAAVVRDTQG